MNDDEIKIKLDENPTTGYMWTYELDNDKVLEEVSSVYKESLVPLIGSGGVHEWRFKIIGDGTVKLTFTYAQNWDGGDTDKTVVNIYTVKNGKLIK